MVRRRDLFSDYIDCDYLLFTGTQWINLNEYLTSDDLDITCKITVDPMPSSEQTLICNQTNSNFRFVLGLYNQYVFGYSKGPSINDDNVVSTTFSGNVTLNIHMNYSRSNLVKTLTVNGTTYTHTQQQGIANDRQKISLCYNRADTNYFVGKFYGMRIKYGDKDFDLVPKINTLTNTAGLYDKNSGVFYTNAGTGIIVGGND